MISGQRVQVGLPHAGKTAESSIETDTYGMIAEDGPAITSGRQPRHPQTQGVALPNRSQIKGLLLPLIR
jgi:hypothetical protein